MEDKEQLMEILRIALTNKNPEKYIEEILKTGEYTMGTQTITVTNAKDEKYSSTTKLESKISEENQAELGEIFNDMKENNLNIGSAIISRSKNKDSKIVVEEIANVALDAIDETKDIAGERDNFKVLFENSASLLKEAKGKNVELSERIDQAQSDYESLKSSNNKLDKAYQEAKQEAAKIIKENKGLKEENNSLQKENDDLDKYKEIIENAKKALDGDGKPSKGDGSTTGNKKPSKTPQNQNQDNPIKNR